MPGSDTSADASTGCSEARHAETARRQTARQSCLCLSRTDCAEIPTRHCRRLTLSQHAQLRRPVAGRNGTWARSLARYSSVLRVCRAVAVLDGDVKGVGRPRSVHHALQVPRASQVVAGSCRSPRLAAISCPARRPCSDAPFRVIAACAASLPAYLGTARPQSLSPSAGVCSRDVPLSRPHLSTAIASAPTSTAPAARPNYSPPLRSMRALS